MKQFQQRKFSLRQAEAGASMPEYVIAAAIFVFALVGVLGFVVSGVKNHYLGQTESHDMTKAKPLYESNPLIDQEISDDGGGVTKPPKLP
jgi:hypothetical protein